MSVEVVIKKVPREVSGKLVKVNESCRLPPELARSLENKGLCVIVAKGLPVAMEDDVQPFVKIETKEAKTARADAASAKKKRAEGKKKAKAK